MHVMSCRCCNVADVTQVPTKSRAEIVEYFWRVTHAPAFQPYWHAFHVAQQRVAASRARPMPTQHTYADDDVIEYVTWHVGCSGTDTR